MESDITDNTLNLISSVLHNNTVTIYSTVSIIEISNIIKWLLMQNTLGYMTVTTDVWLCFIMVGFIQINRQEEKQWTPAPRHSNVRRSKVKAVFRLSVSGCISGRQVSLGSSVHTFHSHSSVQRRVTLFNTVCHLCILHMSNLEAVIGQFCQDECLSKRPWQRSIRYCRKHE